MSGIVGILNGDGEPIDRALLQQMTDLMAFRGPDALDIWSAGHVGFGHALLRTTWESEKERQPHSLDREVWIAADVRLDRRDELIDRLRAGDRAPSNDAPDVDLILHAYRTWGEACLEHLSGDFAFAIWDSRQQRLFCARDQFGVVPFYYTVIGKSLIFSNTPDCLRLHPQVSDRFNERAIGDFLLFNMNMDVATTTFADIQKLPPAHTLIWSGGEVRVRRYWQLPEAADTIPSLSPNRDRPVEYRSGLNALSKTDGSYFHLWFRGCGQIDFEIDSQGSHISATWTYSLLEEVAGLLLGPALGCTLRLRGTACLHACVVGIGQRAIAIVGEKGAGKSTTAAALATRGHSILSDDIAVLNSDGQHFLVQPGYPRLRLWPEAINTLYGSEVGLKRVLSSSEKRYMSLADNSETAWRFQSDPLPLAAIYVLGERVPSLAAPAIEPIPPAISVMALMAHRSASFLTLEREKQAREFALLSRVAVTVPVRKVSRPDSLDALPQLCDAILEDLAGIPTPEKCTL